MADWWDWSEGSAYYVYFTYLILNEQLIISSIEEIETVFPQTSFIYSNFGV